MSQINLVLISAVVSISLSILFDSLSKKEKWDSMLSSSFECGFYSHFFSRFSFSIHYFVVGLIFLFLDLELCFIMPFFLTSDPSMSMMVSIFIFTMVLLGGIFLEWGEGKLDWDY